ncbi:26S proteasome non-ATPase regulatory subunit 12 [Daktulosphaira vitifoliae]|uniref:26S proteasome non-ATPase regulatory subunit 12 n=1 Tax=Daktulosphaira vitifoliae TaxID=58002 RepID=UPI0021A9C58E|nr:26S proteasome non-ATPase regulatory subunit 12 [Daktulosphaira vitifoliae]XP_050539676.1 26S proteasome non-ATPase regulatory subunit 12 [Daktulosphaira vitifoliae]
MMDNLEPLTTDSGRMVKMEVDYSATCDEKISVAESLATSGKLQEALDVLLALEKQTRTGSDMVSTSRVLVAVVQMCFHGKQWSLLNEHIVMLTKRRSQLKLAVAAMVRECCAFIDQTPNKEIKLKLIETLRNVTEGKIYVEVERARLTQKLAKIKEDEGDITGAANIIQELQVETYGSMKKQEKVEIILEQMRLCLAKKDYIRTQIIAKKINTKFFDDEKSEIQQLKLKYYKLMIELGEHDGQYLDICRHYRAIQATPEIEADATKRNAALQNSILYLILAPYDNHQSDLTHRILQDEALLKIPKYKSFLQLFTTMELIQWKELCKEYENELKSGVLATDVFSSNTEKGTKRWTDLKNRVAEHNVRVMAKYYSKIRIVRMAQLLDMKLEDTEQLLSNMVVDKSVTAKIDRPSGVVEFSVVKSVNEVLNEWSFGLNDLMRLVNNTTHLINKEQMVHKHLLSH